MTYHSNRASIQYRYHWSASAGGTKYSISICSNSRTRKRKFPGVISLRNDLPTCAIPNGGRRRASWRTFLKLMKMPCAVSGRRNARAPSSATGPTVVSNMRLNWRGSVRSHSEYSPGRFDGFLPHCESSSLSARKRSLQVRQSTSGSVKPSTWPEASQTRGWRITAESISTMSSRSCTIASSQRARMLFLTSTP